MALFIYLAYIGAVIVAVLVATFLWKLFTLVLGRPRVETHPGYLPPDVPRQFREPFVEWTEDDERAFRAWAERERA